MSCRLLFPAMCPSCSDACPSCPDMCPLCPSCPSCPSCPPCPSCVHVLHVLKCVIHVLYVHYVLDVLTRVRHGLSAPDPACKGACECPMGPIVLVNQRLRLPCPHQGRGRPGRGSRSGRSSPTTIAATTTTSTTTTTPSPHCPRGKLSTCLCGLLLLLYQSPPLQPPPSPHPLPGEEGGGRGNSCPGDSCWLLPPPPTIPTREDLCD